MGIARRPFADFYEVAYDLTEEDRELLIDYLSACAALKNSKFGLSTLGGQKVEQEYADAVMHEGFLLLRPFLNTVTCEKYFSKVMKLIFDDRKYEVLAPEGTKARAIEYYKAEGNRLRYMSSGKTHLKIWETPTKDSDRPRLNENSSECWIGELVLLNKDIASPCSRTPLALLELYLNAFKYHKDRSKRDAIEKLFSARTAEKYSVLPFLTYLSVAIIRLGEIVSAILERSEPSIRILRPFRVRQNDELSSHTLVNVELAGVVLLPSILRMKVPKATMTWHRRTTSFECDHGMYMQYNSNRRDRDATLSFEIDNDPEVEVFLGTNNFNGFVARHDGGGIGFGECEFTVARSEGRLLCSVFARTQFKAEASQTNPVTYDMTIYAPKFDYRYKTRVV